MQLYSFHIYFEMTTLPDTNYYSSKRNIIYQVNTEAVCLHDCKK